MNYYVRSVRNQPTRNSSDDVGEDIDFLRVELEVVERVAVLLEDLDEDGDEAELLEALHVLGRRGALPDGARDGRHQLLLNCPMKLVGPVQD